MDFRRDFRHNFEKTTNNFEEKKNQLSSRLLGVGGIGAIIFIGAFLFFTCTTRIGPGYAGVIYNMDGGIENETLTQGFHIVAPWKHVTEYPISTETVYYTKNTVDGKDKDKKVDNSINVNTKDGKQVNVSVTYAYHMDPQQLPTVFEKFRGQEISLIESGYMKNEMYQAINEITSQYSLMELVGDKRPEVNQKIFEKFRDGLGQFGIVIETFNLSDVVPDDQTAQAIQNVVNAQNTLEQAKIEKQQAEVEAEKARVSAKGEADAALIRATGQSQANAKLQESLTPLVIEQHKLEKWNGELPKYQLGGSGALFNISE